MSECFPNFVKGDTLETREGLQEAEFNKALQAGGVQRERDRRVDAPAKELRPTKWTNSNLPRPTFEQEK